MESVIWKPVRGYEDRYIVSSNGEVMSLDSGTHKGRKNICILLPWFPLPLPQCQRNLPFKLKGDLMFLSIAAPSRLKSVWHFKCDLQTFRMEDALKH